VRYALADLELTAALPELRLDPDQEGVAVLARAGGRPVHYSLHSLPRGARVAPEALWRMIGRMAGPELLAQRIRDELVAPPELVPVDVTAAVCTHGRPELLADLLHSLLAQRRRRPGLKLLVVDNAPPDGATRALAESLPDVRYACEPRPGLDFGRNKALEVADTEFVAFLDDDVVVDRGWLAGLEEALAENPDAGAVTGLVLPRRLDSSAQILFEWRGGFRRGTRKLRYDGTSQPDDPLYPVGAGIFGAGANMVVRRPLALELGGFDEALDTGPPLPGGGDLDMFHRVVQAGRPLCYEPAMLVFHLHRPDMAALRRQYWSWGEGLMAFLARAREAHPQERVKVRGMVAWWLAAYGRDVLGAVRHPGRGRPDMELWELAGGLRGLTGSYRRSQRRVDRIKERHGGA
jgi:GT2 family glycosyltransferase